MNFPSNILTIFGKHDGVQDQRDGVLAVPRFIQPVLSIPEPALDTFYGDQAGTIMRTSFMWSGNIERTNQAGLTNEIGLGAGLWDIELEWQYQANYTDLPNVGGFYIAMVFTSGSQDFQLAAGRPQSTVIIGRVHRRISLTREDGSIFISVSTNGAAETDIFNYSAMINRLG